VLGRAVGQLAVPVGRAGVSLISGYWLEVHGHLY
jgi:hypothetical protein